MGGCQSSSANQDDDFDAINNSGSRSHHRKQRKSTASRRKGSSKVPPSPVEDDEEEETEEEEEEDERPSLNPLRGSPQPNTRHDEDDLSSISSDEFDDAPASKPHVPLLDSQEDANQVIKRSQEKPPASLRSQTTDKQRRASANNNRNGHRPSAGGIPKISTTKDITPHNGNGVGGAEDRANGSQLTLSVGGSVNNSVNTSATTIASVGQPLLEEFVKDVPKVSSKGLSQRVFAWMGEIVPHKSTRKSIDSRMSHDTHDVSSSQISNKTHTSNRTNLGDVSEDRQRSISTMPQASSSRVHEIDGLQIDKAGGSPGVSKTSPSAKPALRAGDAASSRQNGRNGSTEVPQGIVAPGVDLVGMSSFDQGEDRESDTMSSKDSEWMYNLENLQEEYKQREQKREEKKKSSSPRRKSKRHSHRGLVQA